MTENPPENKLPQDNSDQYNSPGPYAATTDLNDLKDQPVKKEKLGREPLSKGGIIAWLVIAVVVTGMVTLTAVARHSEETNTEATASDLFPVQQQARVHVGQKYFFGIQSSKSKDGDSDIDRDIDRDDEDQNQTDSDDENQDADEDQKEKTWSSGPAVPEALNDGTYEQRLCYVLLIRENDGPDEAATKLTELDEAATEADFELNEDQSKLRTIVGTLIKSHQDGDPDAEGTSDDDRDYLKTKLGWIGELALVPEGTRNVETRKELQADASRSMGVMMGFFGLVLLSMMGGVVLAAIFSVLFATKRLEPKFMTRGKSTNIYIETFALWIVFFFVGPQLTALAVSFAGIELGMTADMLISIGFFFGSLVVLVYPVMRGIPFKQVCDDIGWKAKGGLIDILVSPVNYIAGIPLMMIGLVCVGILTVLASMLTAAKPFGTGVAASHPIQDIIASGEWWSILYIVVMACIAAPIVEETMFRGVLYRHLRELSSNWALWGSVIFSAVFNGLIFAAIHPQGFVAIPLLTCLAINFSLVREWRDSLIAPMIMHGINNGAVTALMLLMMM